MPIAYSGLYSVNGTLADRTLNVVCCCCRWNHVPPLDGQHGVLVVNSPPHFARDSTSPPNSDSRRDTLIACACLVEFRNDEPHAISYSLHPFPCVRYRLMPSMPLITTMAAEHGEMDPRTKYYVWAGQGRFTAPGLLLLHVLLLHRLWIMYWVCSARHSRHSLKYCFLWSAPSDCLACVVYVLRLHHARRARKKCFSPPTAIGPIQHRYLPT